MYKNYCMEFTNEELEEFFIKKFIGYPDVTIIRLSSDGEEISKDSEISIETISLDGERENLFVNFMGIQTSILANDTEIMLIDESAKGTYTSSDVFHNVVYEGELRCLKHEQIFELIGELVECFISNQDNEVIELEVPDDKKYKKYNYYDSHCYIINVENKKSDKKQKIFENIVINY